MATVALSHKLNLTKAWEETKPILNNLWLISFGCVLWVIGMNAVLVPAKLISPGVIGISILLNYHFPILDIGLTNFLLNVPLMILGWTALSKRFIAYTIFGNTFFSLAAAFIHPPVPAIEDPMLAALLAGVICGTGSGFVLRSAGSAGGMDIVSVYLKKKLGILVGTTAFVSNAAVISAGAYIHDFQLALYSILFFYVCGRITNSVISGFNTKESVLIVSDHADTIARDIIDGAKSGVTFLDGEGAYSGDKRKVILTIASTTDIPKLKALILKHDKDALVIINDTMEVLGKRYHSLSDY